MIKTRGNGNGKSIFFIHHRLSCFTRKGVRGRTRGGARLGEQGAAETLKALTAR